MITKTSNPIPALDKGFARLEDWMGSDGDICRAARVSYMSENKGAEDRQLIRYMMRHGHTSPFEHVVLKFHCKAPLFVVAQWVRHRTGSFNFRSYRYSEAPEEFYIPEDIRRQAKSNKQGSESLLDESVALEIISLIKESSEIAYLQYEGMLKQDTAREQARMVLPQNLYTEFYWTVNLHNLFHFLGLRLDSHAQAEIRAYAQVLYQLVRQVAPIACEAFEDYKLEAESFSKQEMIIIKMLLEKSTESLVDFEDDYMYSGLTEREFKELKAKIGGS